MDLCRTCRFCQITLEIGAPDPWDFMSAKPVDTAIGRCRFNAPAVVEQDVPIGDGGSYRGARTEWPEINPDKDWCGQHSLAQKVT